MSHTPPEGSLSEILQTAIRILSEEVDLDLAEVDMTTDQKQGAAQALKECTEIFRAYAGDFAAIARHERATFINTITCRS